MTRLRLIAVGVALAVGFSATSAMAQRDAGAKARGEFGSGFWDSGYRQTDSRSFYARPARPGMESYRSFSYEPMGINPGDTVVVRGDGSRLMKGSEVVGTVPEGLEFKVTKVIDGWLGAVVDVEGQELKGWIWHGNVSSREEAAAETAESADDDTQARSVRRFSYEPAQPSRTYRSDERSKEPWQYPKTDPRRYRSR